MIDLSIIIPHYNSPGTLEKLLRSIPKKNNIQVIVIDDNSNKYFDQYTTLKSKREYRHVRFLKNDTKIKGAGACRNIGLEEVKGKWILFADADDYFVENFYHIVYQYFDTDYDVVFFPPISIEIDTGNISNRHIRYVKLINDYKKNNSLQNVTRLKYQFFVPWSKLIRTELIRKYNIKFDEVIASNDVMFSTKIGYFLKSFFVSTEVIYCVTRGVGTLTVTRNQKIFDARLRVHINYCNFLRENLSKEEVKYLNLNGIGILLRAIKNKLGFSTTITSYKLLKKNKINILDKRFFNPFFVITKIIRHLKRFRKEKRYYE